MDAVFRPFVEAAEKPELLPRLKTRELSDERKKTQYPKLKTLEKSGKNPLVFWDRNVLIPFAYNQKQYIFLSIEGKTEKDISDIVDWLSTSNFKEEEIDENIFLFLAYYHNNIYSIKDSFKSKTMSDEVIDVISDDYVGHDIYDLISYYVSGIVFSCDKNFALSTHKLATEVCVASPTYCSPTASNIASDVGSRFTNLSNINFENIFFGLSSFSWKHIFLEFYKALEFTYYLPWAWNLRKDTAYKGAAFQLAQAARKSLNWREKEKESIQVLFDMCPDHLIVKLNSLSFAPFSEINGKEENVKQLMASRIYGIRSYIVHHIDYDSKKYIEIENENWPVVVSYLLDIIHYVYSNWSADIDGLRI